MKKKILKQKSNKDVYKKCEQCKELFRPINKGAVKIQYDPNNMENMFACDHFCYECFLKIADDYELQGVKFSNYLGLLRDSSN
jgi:hypothetical protein